MCVYVLGERDLNQPGPFSGVAVMDPKSKEIYNKIEHFLEERKGRDRRKDETPEEAKANAERRSGDDRRETTG